MAERSRDWMTQAVSDLRHARNARGNSEFDWSAFASHQAAEKLSQLLAALPEPQRPGAELVDRAKELDKHYVPTRYPNGFERGAPTELYTAREADQAIAAAEAILEHCRRQIG
ncbi:MAG TPA: HEPN domain-containing protein [Vicinamibacteria bacterium]|nr:HEPN domain-containing protein [Vicinamibacteria bacterium]